MKSLIIALLFASACVSGSADESHACYSKTVTFPGGLPLFQATKSVSLDVGFGKDLVTNISLVDGRLTLATGNFGFINDIAISVVDPNGVKDIVLWNSHGGNMGINILAVMPSSANFVNYIDSSNKFTLDLTISAQTPPANDWDLTAWLCVSAEVDKTITL